MADLTITAANVLASNGATKRTGKAGATITQGQTVYVDAADSSKVKLADNNASATTADVKGIALQSVASGQDITFVEEDSDFTPGATLTVGTIYAQSATAGGICPVADLSSGMYPAVLFIAKSTTKAVMKIVKGGVAI